MRKALRALFGALLLSGCGGDAQPRPPLRPAERPPAPVRAGDRLAGDRIEAVSIRLRNAGGFTWYDAVLRNRKNRRLRLECRVRFLDDAGFEIRPRPARWEVLHFAPGGTLDVSGRCAAPGVSAIAFEFRRPGRRGANPAGNEEYRPPTRRPPFRRTPPSRPIPEGTSP